MSKRLIIPLVAVLSVMAPLSAQAGDVSVLTRASDKVVSWLGVDSVMGFSLKFAPTPQQDTTEPSPAAAAPMIVPAPVAVRVTKADLAALKMPTIQPLQESAALPEPTVEKGLKKLYCVEYARAVSGLAIFGDAKLWWDRAKSLYARAAQPVEEAVMVFSGSKRLAHGHVAVVTNIVSAREIRVDQANWLNHGEIDHSTPVLDVSTANDWSKVRVWDVPSHSFGSRVYAISGFIVKGLTRQASND